MFQLLSLFRRDFRVPLFLTWSIWAQICQHFRMLQFCEIIYVQQDTQVWPWVPSQFPTGSSYFSHQENPSPRKIQECPCEPTPHPPPRMGVCPQCSSGTRDGRFGSMCGAGLSTSVYSSSSLLHGEHLLAGHFTCMCSVSPVVPETVSPLCSSLFSPGACPVWATTGPHGLCLPVWFRWGFLTWDGRKGGQGRFQQGCLRMDVSLFSRLNISTGFSPLASSNCSLPSSLQALGW